LEKEHVERRFAYGGCTLEPVVGGTMFLSGRMTGSGRNEPTVPKLESSRSARPLTVRLTASTTH